MASRGTKYSDQTRERAVRLLRERVKGDERTDAQRLKSVAEKMGMTPETLRCWVRQAEVDAGVPVHPEMAGSAETVVSSWVSASTAQPTARAVSLARGWASGWVSENVNCGQVGSAQRQIRLRHTTTVGTAKHGASWTRCSAPVPDSNNPTGRAAADVLVGLHRHN